MGRDHLHSDHCVRPLRDRRLLEFPDLMDAVQFAMEAYYTSKSVEVKLDEQLADGYARLQSEAALGFDRDDVMAENAMVRDTLMCDVEGLCRDFAKRVRRALEEFHEQVIDQLHARDDSLVSNRLFLKYSFSDTVCATFRNLSP